MSNPIRILHIVQRMEAGGTQSFLMNLYRNIDRSKVQFDFLVEYEEKEFYDDEIISLGGKIYYTNFRKTLNLIKFRRTMSDILKEHPEYKIVHIHATAIGKICTDVARKCGVKTIIAHTHNNSAVKDWKYYPKILLRKLYTNGPTDFFACSEDAGRYTFKNKKFTVIYNAIDIDKFLFNQEVRENFRKELNIEDKFVIGNIGRLHEQKNQSFLIDIFYEIQKNKDNAILLIIGKGPLENELKEKVSNLGINNKVYFLGNRKDVERIYQGMDVFVLPSLFEGLGIVAVEAQVSGLPVVASTGVAKEANITNNIQNIDLNDSIDTWKEAICKSNVESRNSVEKIVRNSKFDVKNNAKFLQESYLKKYYGDNYRENNE
ncbi:MAG: glycosyltransferase family 1 protein [Clostridiales bacterium]|nr:glycosyltransferase family 1 protein [Clostridiales bacterium]